MRPAQEAEYVAFAEASRPRLLRQAWLLTGDPARAEDIVQEALIKLYLHWPRLQSGGEMAYARRTVTTTHIDLYRKHSREHLQSVPTDRPQTPPEPEDTAFLLRERTAYVAVFGPDEYITHLAYRDAGGRTVDVALARD